MKTLDNRFNLIDEPWIPVVDVGLVSLREAFQTEGYRQLGGNSVEKIALTKLLLAIAQAAATPSDEAQWRALGSTGLVKDCVDYLDRWHDRFYLFGERPFLQMPAIDQATQQPYGAIILGIATGNTTILGHSQIQREFSDAQKAMALVVQMSMALGGKKTDNSVTLSIGYSGKKNDKGLPSTAKAGPSIGHMGYLHSFLIGESLHETLWINLLTIQRINQTNMFQSGLGVAPWESMPQGEDCSVAKNLRESLMGRLIPMCRFCLLTDNGLHYSEGLLHPNYKEGVVDPTMSVNNTGKDPKVLWADPDKRPWRELTSLLSFIDQTDTAGVQNLQIRTGIDRLQDLEGVFAVWSGGLRVSISVAMDQYTTGGDDFVESVVWLPKTILDYIAYQQLKSEMDALSDLSKILYGRVCGYLNEMSGHGKSQDEKAQKAPKGRDDKVAKARAESAICLFWQLCERDFQRLVQSCHSGEEEAKQRIQLRRLYASYLHSAYDQACAKETAKQIDAWAKHRPNLAKYLKQES